MSEDELRLRKLKAETELAERQLQESKKRRCGKCGGHGGYTTVEYSSAYRNSGLRSGGARRTWVSCTGCGGSGFVYEK